MKLVDKLKKYGKSAAVVASIPAAGYAGYKYAQHSMEHVPAVPVSSLDDELSKEVDDHSGVIKAALGAAALIALLKMRRKKAEKEKAYKQSDEFKTAHANQEMQKKAAQEWKEAKEHKTEPYSPTSTAKHEASKPIKIQESEENKEDFEDMTKHIKKGKFTAWCKNHGHEDVTDDCISQAIKESNETKNNTLKKQAVLARTFRSIKH